MEEAGNYPDSRPIDMLFGALRSKSGVPIQLILTANPGGSGQQWIKHRFIMVIKYFYPLFFFFFFYLLHYCIEYEVYERGYRDWETLVSPVTIDTLKY